ncbi:hypothetical protein BH09PSE6_BH09PSE6_21330 [soil metagenome]
MIYLLAIIVAKPGMRDAILAAFQANAPTVRAEPGCIEYTAVVDMADAPTFQVPVGPDTFIVVEKWAGKQALEAHAAAPHMASYSATTRPWIESRTLHILSAA